MALDVAPARGTRPRRSLDILPTPSVDIVSEAEALPFADNSTDYISSGAVFEHVFDPLASAREVRRVLKDGGRFYIDTAFMQLYHRFPSHYFNMTPQAVETFIIDDFILEDSLVPSLGAPARTLMDLLDRFIHLLPAPELKRFKSLTVEELVSELHADPSIHNRLFSSLPEHDQRSMASSFVVVGRKPHGYNSRRKDDAHSISARRDYAAPVEVMMHHNHAVFYANRTNERYRTLRLSLPSRTARPIPFGGGKLIGEKPYLSIAEMGFVNICLSDPSTCQACQRMWKVQ